MNRPSTRRMSTVFLMVLSLLFSQLALANYVCPKQADVASMAEMMASGVPCEGMDMDQPARRDGGGCRSWLVVTQPLNGPWYWRLYLAAEPKNWSVAEANRHGQRPDARSLRNTYPRIYHSL